MMRGYLVVLECGCESGCELDGGLRMGFAVMFTFYIKLIGNVITILALLY